MRRSLDPKERNDVCFTNRLQDPCPTTAGCARGRRYFRQPQPGARTGCPRQHGERDWNTLAAKPTPRPTAPFGVGDRVKGTFNGNPAEGRVIGLSETIKPDLWRATIAFDPPVDVVTSKLFSSERKRIEMIVGADGRSRRLTGTETGVMALHRA